MSGYGLSRTKSEMILDSRGIDIRPTTGFLTRTRSLADVTQERLWSQRYHPQWPYYLTAYTPTQPHRYVSNIYSSNPLTYYKYARYLNQDNWYDRYSQYPLSYNRNWLDRRYYSRNYLPYRRWFGYPFIGYSSSMYSPYTNYALTGLEKMAHGIWGVHELSSIREVEKPDSNIDLRSTKGYLPKTWSVPDLGKYSEGYQPKWPNFYSYESRYAACHLPYYRYARHMGDEQWFDRYAQYTDTPYARSWIPRRYNRSYYLANRRWYDYPYSSYSSSAMSPVSSYILSAH